MQTLKEIRDKGPEADVLCTETREAARAVAFDENGRMPVLFVGKHGYHKLPGGGIEAGEDVMQALAREMKEETGCSIEVTGEIGTIVEYRTDWHIKQTSHCYLAKITTKGETAFDDGEKENDFKLVWMTLDEAIETLKKDQPANYYDGGFIRERDLAFLKQAKHLTQTEEYLDVFDENNQPTGVALSRAQVHTEALWHRTVHIYLFRKSADGLEFLLHLRSKLKEASPGLWDTRFGGHIKAGQSVEEGVRDELHEEIGLDTSRIHLIEGEWQKRDNFPNREYTKFYFLEYNDSLENLKFNDGEVDEVKWMNVETLKENIKNTPEAYSASLSGFEKILKSLKEKI